MSYNHSWQQQACMAFCGVSLEAVPYFLSVLLVLCLFVLGSSVDVPQSWTVSSMLSIE